jgi:HrpA-like RNA helicase
MNPLTKRQYSKKYYETMKIINELPVSGAIDEFTEKLKNSSVIVFESGTGSGKSVRIPVIAYEYYKYRKKIVLTQPRTVTITGIANFMRDQLDSKFEVGYIYGADSDYSSKTDIFIITDTIFRRVNKLLEILSVSDNPVIVFLDEMHERSIYMDIIMANFFMFYKQNKDIPIERLPKLILLSATIDVSKYVDYFDSVAVTSSMSVPGKTQPLEHMFLTSPVTNMENSIIEIINKIMSGSIEFPLKLSDTPDILIFMPTFSACSKLIRKIKNNLKDQSILTGILARKISEIERNFLIKSRDEYSTGYEKHFGIPGGPFKRKILVATDIAKTGLTVRGLEIVIDSGLENYVTFDPKTEIKTQMVSFTNQASAMQRSGRAGRTNPGIAIHMYTREQFKEFPKYTIPNIKSSDYVDLLKTMLELARSSDEVLLISKFMIDKPNADLLDKTILQFYDWGLLESGLVTNNGSVAFNLGVDVSLAMLIINSIKYTCIREMIPIVSFLYVDSRLKSWGIKTVPEYGDPIAFLKLWNDFYNGFIIQNLVQYKASVSRRGLQKRVWYIKRLETYCNRKKLPYEEYKKFMFILLKLQSRLRGFRRKLKKVITFKTGSIFERIIMTFTKTFIDNRLIKRNGLYEIHKTGTLIKYKSKNKLIGYIEILKLSFGGVILSCPFVIIK